MFFFLIKNAIIKTFLSKLVTIYSETFYCSQFHHRTTITILQKTCAQKLVYWKIRQTNRILLKLYFSVKFCNSRERHVFYYDQ